MAATVHDQSAPAMPNGSAHPFTCNTCQVAFRSSDLQRTHMQSDWHRYNLKRRVASLPPLASEIFADKVLANKASAAATAARASFERRCEACDKTYYSEGAYVNHLGSQKHRLLTTRLFAKSSMIDGTETDSMAESTFTLGETLSTSSSKASTVNGDDVTTEDYVERVVEKIKDTTVGETVQPALVISRTNEDSEQADDYEHKANLSQCLFCNYVSPTVDLNLHHMTRQHSFFIPEKDYLVDLPGLLNYLNETVTVLHHCLFCHKQVHTTSGVQTHMRDRGHCMIAYSTEDEQLDIGDFYDFRSTYSDDENETEGEDEKANTGGVSLGARRVAKTTVENEHGEDVDMVDDQDGWESDSSLSSVPTDEITSVPVDQSHKFETLGLHRHHSHKDPRPHKNSDGFHSHAHHASHAVYHDDYELHLPSGRTAGHRSLRAYYRQNLRNYPSAEERSQQRLIEHDRHDSDADDEDAEQDDGETSRGRQVASRADGGLGMVGASEGKKREVKAAEKRERKREQRAHARYEWGKNKRANFQEHFRDHLLQ